MKKRKRAPGAGRKPQGEFSQLTVPFSVRMPAAMRNELKKAARDRGRKEGQELLRRLQDSFTQDRDRARDPAMRALCFLFSELAENAHLGVRGWRSDPFLFRAVKIGIGRLLDALEPPGEVKASSRWKEAFANFAKDRIFEGHMPVKAWMDQISASPEALAGHAVSAVMVPLNATHLRLTTMRMDYSKSQYGIEAARRDLSIKRERP
jgi:Arc-like DNA binding dprotein